MNLSEMRVGTRRMRSFPRAKFRWGTLVLLIALRCYALAAVGIALYAFIRAVR